MTATINGIGTSFSGKKNFFSRVGFCENCHNEVELKSYDTWHCFCFVFIPVLPLGKKRITDMCSSCSYHFVGSLSKYTKGKEQDIQESLEKFKQNTDNAEQFKETIALVTTYQDEDTVAILGQAVERFMPNNVEVLMMMAAAHNYFNHDSEANALYKKILVLEPENTDAKEALAIALMDAGQAAEAEPMVRHVITEKIHEKQGLGFLLIESYLRNENFDQAKLYVDTLSKTFPDLSADKEFKKLAKSVEKRKKIPALKKPRKTAGVGGGLGNMLPFVTVPVLIIGFLIASFVLGQSRDVYFVNGLDVAYTIKVDGQEYTIGSHRKKEITVSGSSVSYEVLGPDFKNLSSQFEINDSFLSRPFSDDVYVVNPDKCAILLWEKIPYYTNNRQDSPDSKFTSKFGENFYVYDDIDYAFKPAPSQVQVKSGNVAFKNRVSLAPAVTPMELTNYFWRETVNDRKKYEDCLRALSMGNPDEMSYYYGLQMVMKVPEFITLIRTRLGGRGQNVNFHRLYQGVIEGQGDDHDLVGEYQKMMEDNPDNAKFKYLLGRIMPNARKATALYKEALANKKPCLWAHLGLAYQYQATGEFKKALEHVQAGKKGDPNMIASLEFYEKDIMLALGQYDALLAQIAKVKKERSLFYSLFQQESMILALKGQGGKAKNLLKKYIKDLGRSGEEKSSVDYTQKLLLANLHYALGEFEEYEKHCIALEEPLLAFQSQITVGKLKEAEKTLTTLGEADYSSHVALSIAASQQSDKKLAAKYLLKTIEKLKEGNQNFKALGELLASDKAPSFESIMNYPQAASQQKLLLTAFGLKFPSLKKPCFELAKKLNYSPEYPMQLLKKVLE